MNPTVWIVWIMPEEGTGPIVEDEALSVCHGPNRPPPRVEGVA